MPTTITHPRRHPESELQRICVRWFRLQYPNLSSLLFAVPNGGKRSAVEAGIMRAEGVTAGVSDLILLVPSDQYHALCIEMKYGNGKQSHHQLDWQNAVEEQGYRYVVCRSLDDFITTVNHHLNKILKHEVYKALRS